jgi:hypothetical protein
VRLAEIQEILCADFLREIVTPDFPPASSEAFTYDEDFKTKGSVFRETSLMQSVNI